MSNSNRTTVTVYPFWMYWIGQFLWYMALLTAPLVFIQWLSTLVPIFEAVINLVMMPLLYGGLYMLLRKFRMRSQNFIYVVIFLFIGITYIQGKTAWTTGSWNNWIGAMLGIVYAIGFVWLAIRGRKENQNDEWKGVVADRENQIDLHAEAIIRAKQIEQREIH